MTTAVDDLFQPDPLAHFVPTKYIELETTPLDVKIFSFHKEIRYNPLRLMYRRIKGLLENACPNKLDDLIPLAERNAGKVALTSPLAFLLVAREHYRAFNNHNEDERILQVEMNRLVTIVMCALPSFAAYMNHTLPQMRLVKPLCFKVVQYVLNREHWETLLYLQMPSFCSTSTSLRNSLSPIWPLPMVSGTQWKGETVTHPSTGCTSGPPASRHRQSNGYSASGWHWPTTTQRRCVPTSSPPRAGRKCYLRL